MRYSNSNARKMNSDRMIFRPTALALAMQEAGITKKTHLVIEPKTEWPVRGVE